MKNNIYLIGKTNVGKTNLFNQLTGSDKKVANYHGVTTTLSKAPFLDNANITVYDLPGTYALEKKSQDESLTLETLKETSKNSLWLIVLDAVELKSNLKDLANLLGFFKERQGRIVVAINMIDEAEFNDIKIDWGLLDQFKNIIFVPTSAKKGINIDKLKNEINRSFKTPLKNFKLVEKELQNLDLNSSLVLNPDNQVALKRVESLDKIFLSKFFGPVLFSLIMLVLFQSVFTWATPFMELIEHGLMNLGAFVSSKLSNQGLKSFFEDAIFGGFGAFLVFIPQIFILSFLIKTLEDSGYFSRASLICNRFLAFFGLSGESFIPLLTSHACAIPGIFATRSIKSKKIRILTLLTLPLTVCSARLPVYALLITVTVPQTYILGGLVGYRGFSLFVLYLFGIFLSLITSSFLSRASRTRASKTRDSRASKTRASRASRASRDSRDSFKESQDLLAIQLTRYQWPDFTKALKSGLNSSFHFVKDAGLIIFLTNSLIWILGVLPNGFNGSNGSEGFKESYLNSIGKAVHFIFAPLGMSWQESVAVLTSFLARETFVSTLGTLYNLDSEEVMPLAKLMMNSQNANQMASALALIVFFAIALQCVSTVALLKTELPKKIWSVYLFGAYFVLAYTLSFITYRVALLF